MKSNCYYSEYQCPDHYKQDVDQTEDMKMNGIQKQSQTFFSVFFSQRKHPSLSFAREVEGVIYECCI